MARPDRRASCRLQTAPRKWPGTPRHDRREDVAGKKYPPAVTGTSWVWGGSPRTLGTTKRAPLLVPAADGTAAHGTKKPPAGAADDSNCTPPQPSPLGAENLTVTTDPTGPLVGATDTRGATVALACLGLIKAPSAINAAASEKRSNRRICVDRIALEPPERARRAPLSSILHRCGEQIAASVAHNLDVPRCHLAPLLVTRHDATPLRGKPMLHASRCMKCTTSVLSSRRKSTHRMPSRALHLVSPRRRRTRHRRSCTRHLERTAASTPWRQAWRLSQ